jgi:branched-chain amino acid transport system ATP-binding protein
MTPIEIKGLHKRFGGVAATDGVTMTIAPGERRLIIGPNGAGKTTLFNLLTGTLLPDSGQVLFFGEDITRQPMHKRARLGLSRTFQVTSLMRGLTVLDNAILALQANEPMRWSPYLPAAERRRWTEMGMELLAKWSLACETDRLVRHLSHGAQRHLEIALALAHSPRVLLLDEPTAGMSPAETAAISDAVRSISRDVTILIIEHDLSIAFSLAERVSVMHQGKLLLEGSVDEIRNNDEITRIYFGAESTPEMAVR